MEESENGQTVNSISQRSPAVPVSASRPDGSGELTEIDRLSSLLICW